MDLLWGLLRVFLRVLYFQGGRIIYGAFTGAFMGALF